MHTLPVDPLEGSPLEKQMDKLSQLAGARARLGGGALCRFLIFASSPNLARVNVAIDVPNDSLNFNKDGGNYHSDVNVLCITYKQDDTVGTLFCNTLEPDLTKEEGISVVPFTLKLRDQDLPPGAYCLALRGVDSANYQAPQKEIEFTT